MKTKIIIASIVSMLVLGLAAAGCWWLMRPQTIVLGDGTQLTLLGVTYGKHHSCPIQKIGGRKIMGGSLETTNDSLCIWLEQKSKKNNWPNYQLLAYDSANTGCSGDSRRTYASFGGNNQSDQVVGFAYQAFPRRSSRIYFGIQQWNQRGHEDVNKSRFSVRNPASHGSWAAWKPDAVPNTQQDGDLQMTLTKCELENNTFNNFGNRNNKGHDPMNQGVYTSFRVEQNGNALTNWQPVHIETSDATGNHTGNRGWSNRQEKDEEVMIYQWGLWPDEPAWKLRVEMSRNSAFTDDEMWTASNIPLEPGNINDMYRQDMKKTPAAEKKMGEATLQVFPAIQVTAEQGRMYGNGMEAVVAIQVKPEPEGMRMNMVKITDDQGNPVKFSNWGWGGGTYRFSLSKIHDAKSINLTLAFHRSRFFEYTVKPAKK